MAVVSPTVNMTSPVGLRENSRLANGGDVWKLVASMRQNHHRIRISAKVVHL